MADPTYAEMLSAAKQAMLRMLNGAKSVTVNGQSYHYTDQSSLQNAIDWLETKVAEENGTDGRGAWEATFND